jgi:RimJ/RimL family protein N-acetyltransferase
VGAKNLILEGRSVRLEPLQEEQVSELFPAAAEEDIWKYMSMQVRTEGDLARWVSQRLEAVKNGTALAFLQRDIQTSQAFGSTSLFDIDKQNRRMEIGHTWIGRTHRRTAANTESKLLLFTYAFEGLNAVRVQLKTDPRNMRSQAAIERLGEVREGLLHNYIVFDDGSVHDRIMYSVTDSEWPKVKDRLRGLLSKNG